MRLDPDAALAWFAQTLPQAAVAGGWIAARPPGPAVEEASLARAGAARLAEFRAGRAAAREALGRLGWPASPIPRGEAGAPIWPDGVVGSIAHTETAVFVAVAPAASLAAVGLDVEADVSLEAELVDRVLSHDEAQAARGALKGEFEAGKLAFTAKEAWYKAIFPRTGEALDFRDVQVRFEPDPTEPGAWPGGAFEIAAPARFGALHGRYGRAGGFILAAAWRSA